MSETPEGVPTRDFYAAIGEATTAWFQLEEALRDIFCRLLMCSLAGGMSGFGFDQYWLTGKIFYSSTNLRSKISLMDDIIGRLVEDKKIKTEWAACKNRVSDLYKRRNLMAHGTIWGGGSDEAFHLSGPVFDGAQKRMTYDQVVSASKSFKSMADRLTNVAIAVNAHLVESGRAAPIQGSRSPN